MKELQITVSCAEHGEKARIYRVQTENEQVWQNVTEPAVMAGEQFCLICGEPLEFTRND